MLSTGTVAVNDKAVGPIINRRCMTCHNAAVPLGPGIDKTQPPKCVPKHCLNLYNLSRPENSMILLAPLAKEAGGYQWCKSKSADGQAGQLAGVFRDAGSRLPGHSPGNPGGQGTTGDDQAVRYAGIPPE